MLIHEPLLTGGHLLVVAVELAGWLLTAHHVFPLLAVPAVGAAGYHWHFLVRGGAVVGCRPLLAHLMLRQPLLIEIQLGAVLLDLLLLHFIRILSVVYSLVPGVLVPLLR